MHVVGRRCWFSDSGMVQFCSMKIFQGTIINYSQVIYLIRFIIIIIFVYLSNVKVHFFRIYFSVIYSLISPNDYHYLFEILEEVRLTSTLHVSKIFLNKNDIDVVADFWLRLVYTILFLLHILINKSLYNVVNIWVFLKKISKNIKNRLAEKENLSYVSISSNNTTSVNIRGDINSGIASLVDVKCLSEEYKVSFFFLRYVFINRGKLWTQYLS